MGRKCQEGAQTILRAGLVMGRRKPKELTTTYLWAVRPSQAWSSISSVRLLGEDQESKPVLAKA